MNQNRYMIHWKQLDSTLLSQAKKRTTIISRLNLKGVIRHNLQKLESEGEKSYSLLWKKKHTHTSCSVEARLST
jgi:hypothetical protein